MIPYFNVTLECYKRHDLLYIKLNSISKYNVFSFFQNVFRQSLTNSDLFRSQIIAIRAITMYRSDIRTSGYNLGVGYCVIMELSNANTEIVVFEICLTPLKA